MALRTGVYIVPTNRWYIERTVWLIAGFVLLISTALALLVQPLWILGVAATGLISINVGVTGFCPIGNLLRLFGFTPMLGSQTPRRWNLYFMQTDKWYLERRIYVAVGFNITVASLLILGVSRWFALFTTFVGGAMVWFAPPASASWPMRFTGWAPNRASLRPRCPPAAARSADCRPSAWADIRTGGKRKPWSC
jgi:hypothetical protein